LRTAAKALEEAGAIIVAVATVVDRDTGADKVIGDAGYRYLSAVSLDDLELR
jgi:orotate phosphoribosyltransferase